MRFGDGGTVYGVRHGEEQAESVKLLEQHRKRLLEKVHMNEKRIDCLDYLVFQMNKEE